MFRGVVHARRGSLLQPAVVVLALLAQDSACLSLSTRHERAKH